MTPDAGEQSGPQPAQGPLWHRFRETALSTKMESRATVFHLPLKGRCVRNVKDPEARLPRGHTDTEKRRTGHTFPTPSGEGAGRSGVPTFLRRGQVRVAARQGAVSNVIEQQPLEKGREPVFSGPRGDSEAF